MDLFTLEKETYAVVEHITGLDSVLWVERYNYPGGEVRVVCDPTEQYVSLFAPGTFISHTNTNVVMEVETATIDETKPGPAKLEVFGRCAAAVIMDHRVVTYSMAVPDWAPAPVEQMGVYSTSPMEFELPADYSWMHVNTLLDRYLVNPDDYDPGALTLGAIEALPNVLVTYDVGVFYEVASKTRVIKNLSYLSNAVYEILRAADLGLKVSRPTDTVPEFRFIAYLGENRSELVQFNSSRDEIVKPRYVWSNQDRKTGGYAVTDGHTQRTLSHTATGWDCRNVSVDAKDWDLLTSATPSDPIDVLYSRITDISNAQQPVGLIECEVNSSHFKYGLDYFMGDLVFVAANYEAGKQMRVIEHATLVDKTETKYITTVSAPYAEVLESIG